MSDQLTKIDCDILLDSLESWERDVGSFVADILGSLIAPAASLKARTRYEQGRKERHAREKLERQSRKERVILLKAKILKLRDSILADELTS